MGVQHARFTQKYPNVSMHITLPNPPISYLHVNNRLPGCVSGVDRDKSIRAANNYSSYICTIHS